MEMNFTPDEYETFKLGYGDILLNEGQSMELVGRPAMYRGEVSGSCFTNTLVRFRASQGLDRLFALNVFLAYLKNGRFQKIATITVNIAHLGARRFAELEFPLPTLAEQERIVAEVAERLSQIEAAEKTITEGLKRAARLRQSILKEAFAGKLVPQDPADEPASVLLARICQQQNLPTPDPKRVSTRGRRRESSLDMVGFVTAYILNLFMLNFNEMPGRVINAKLLYMLQNHFLLFLNLTFSRQKYGPFDEAIHKAERIARKQGWFDFREQTKSKERTNYTLTDGTPQAVAQAEAFLGEHRAGFDALIKHFGPLDTDEAELFATVYAAWNDLIIDGRPTDVDTIVAEVYGWHESKKKFTPEAIITQIGTLRTLGYIPTGQGQRTQPLEPQAKPGRKRKS
ncbi:MAG: restriction endonuclease subunit S [Fimbriiglobus sp.]